MPRGPTTAWVDITGLISEWFQTTSINKKSQKEVSKIVLYLCREANIPSNRLLLPPWWRSKGGTRYPPDSHHHHHHLNDTHLHYHNIMKICNFSLRQGLTNSLVTLGLEGTAIDQKYFHWLMSIQQDDDDNSDAADLYQGFANSSAKFSCSTKARSGRTALAGRRHHFHHQRSLSSTSPSLLVSYPTRWFLLFIFGSLYASSELAVAAPYSWV